MKHVCQLVIATILATGIGASWSVANPDLYSRQPVAGWSANTWSFMTAWNLGSGQLEVSQNWYSGRLQWSHSAPKTQWIARFTYDVATGRTSELAWYYSQVFVQ